MKTNHPFTDSSAFELSLLNWPILYPDGKDGLAIGVGRSALKIASPFQGPVAFLWLLSYYTSRH